MAQTPQTFKDLDSWIRHRLRAIQLKHWRRGSTVYSRLRSLGVNHEVAADCYPEPVVLASGMLEENALGGNPGLDFLRQDTSSVNNDGPRLASDLRQLTESAEDHDGHISDCREDTLRGVVRIGYQVEMNKL